MAKIYKRKLVVKSDDENNEIESGKNKKLVKAVAESTFEEESDSDTDSSSSDASPEDIRRIIEPYTKDQLVDLIVDLSVAHPALYSSIVKAADRDVTHRKVFVHGLGWDTTQEMLLEIFGTYGKIEECKVVMDRVTGKAKGYGFILYKSRKGANKALEQPRKKVGNRMAQCQLASAGPPVTPSQSNPVDVSGRKIYVSNVQADVDAEKLRDFFGRFGEIETGPIGFDMQTGKSRGFALFVYRNEVGAKKALEEPYKLFDGHQLHCQMATDGRNINKPVVTGSLNSHLQQPVQAQQPLLNALAAQSMMFNPQQSMSYLGMGLNMNPLYSGLVAGPNVSLMGATPTSMMNPSLLPSSGQLGVGTLAGMGSLGGPSSALGIYGSAGQAFGMQHAYSSLQNGQMNPGVRPQGTSVKYPSQICLTPITTISRDIIL